MHTPGVRETSPAETLRIDCDCAIAQVMLRLAADGVSVRRSFDLDSACGSLVHNICPHSGESPCQCRLIVLILSDPFGHIATLIAHGDGELTELYLVDVNASHPDPDFERQICVALVSLRAYNQRGGETAPARHGPGGK